MKTLCNYLLIVGVLYIAFQVTIELEKSQTSVTFIAFKSK